MKTAFLVSKDLLDVIYQKYLNCFQILCKWRNYFYVWNVSGRECERRGIRVRLGCNSYPISAKSNLHDRYS